MVIQAVILGISFKMDERKITKATCGETSFKLPHNWHAAPLTLCVAPFRSSESFSSPRQH